MIASYLEAVKIYPLLSLNTPADWQILERIFTGKDGDNVDYQIKFNTIYTAKEAEDVILAWLIEIGYSKEDLVKIQQTANSDIVKSSLANQKDIVENTIKTIKIPTIMFEGRRYDRAIGPEKLIN